MVVAAPPVAPGLAGPFLSAVAAAIDSVVVGAARLVIDRTVMPSPDEVEAMRRQAAFYRDPALLADPRRFFAFLARPEPAPDHVLEAPMEPGPPPPAPA